MIDAFRPAASEAPTLLLRAKDTPHGLALPHEQRAGEVLELEAYAVEPRRRGQWIDRSVTLIDDVVTTGGSIADAAPMQRDA